MTVRRVAVTVVSLGLVGWSCGSRGAGDVPRFGAEPERELVTVRRRDLTSVVTIVAAVVAAPRVTFASPGAGKFTVRMEGGVIVGAGVGPSGAPPVLVPIPPNVSSLHAIVPDGSAVVAGVPVVTGSVQGFALQAQLPGDLMYRLFGGVGRTRGSIDHGPGPFECPILGVPVSLGGASPETVSPDSGTAAGVIPDSAAAVSAGSANQATAAVTVPAPGAVISCSVPADVVVLAGSPALMAIETGHAESVLTLPIEAVAGSSQRGRVSVVSASGVVEDRDVRLGLTDGRFVEIVGGLADGDRVAATAPVLAP